MIYKESAGKVIFEQDGATGRSVNTANGCEYVSLELAPKSEIAGHKVPMPVTFYIIQGEGIINNDNDSYAVNSGDMLEIPGNADRSLSNPGTETLKILVIKHLTA